MKDRTDKVEMLNKVISRMNAMFQHFDKTIEPESRYKLMIDRDTFHQLVLDNVDSFVEGKDWMAYRGVRMVRNDYVEGIWVELQ